MLVLVEVACMREEEEVEKEEVRCAQCQYSYFCTSKASKLRYSVSLLPTSARWRRRGVGRRKEERLFV
jgi:hypothetical protein